MIFVCILVAVAAYFLGSIPAGYLMGRAKGIDVRKVGSGNIGATNAFRVLGTVPGILVLVIDGLKGWAAVALVSEWIYNWMRRPGEPADADTLEYLQIIAALCVVLGHNYTCWLKFKGGKGIATSAGVLAALVPFSFAVSMGTWIIACLLTRYVSVASLAASAILPFATLATRWFHPFGIQGSYLLVIITAAMAVLAIYKHKGNIQRLMQGTESKIGVKKNPPATGAAT